MEFGLFGIQAFPGDGRELLLQGLAPVLVVDVDEVELVQYAVEDVHPRDDADHPAFRTDDREASHLEFVELFDDGGQILFLVDGDGIGRHVGFDGILYGALVQGVDDVLNRDDAPEHAVAVDDRKSRNFLDAHHLLGLAHLLVGGQGGDGACHDVGGAQVPENFGVLPDSAQVFFLVHSMPLNPAL